MPPPRSIPGRPNRTLVEQMAKKEASSMKSGKLEKAQEPAIQYDEEDAAPKKKKIGKEAYFEALGELQIELVKLIREMSLAGHAQFIVATHSPILLACPGARILSFDSIPVREIAYEDTEHYKVYKAFMEDREKYLGENGNERTKGEEER